MASFMVAVQVASSVPAPGVQRSLSDMPSTSRSKPSAVTISLACGSSSIRSRGTSTPSMRSSVDSAKMSFQSRQSTDRRSILTDSDSLLPATRLFMPKCARRGSAAKVARIVSSCWAGLASLSSAPNFISASMSGKTSPANSRDSSEPKPSGLFAFSAFRMKLSMPSVDRPVRVIPPSEKAVFSAGASTASPSIRKVPIRQAE